jgi:uncharacterized protein (TIGR00725 family)
MTVGLLPGENRLDANGWVQVAVPTGLGEARNALIARAADAVVAVGGSWGTLSEIALAMKRGVPVVGIETWEVSQGGLPVTDILHASDGVRAVALALQHIRH